MPKKKVEEQVVAESPKCINMGCPNNDDTQEGGCFMDVRCAEFFTGTGTEVAQIDDGSHKCDTCALDFAACQSTAVVFGIDVYPDAEGKEVDRVVNCGAFVSSAESGDDVITDIHGKPADVILEDFAAAHVCNIELGPLFHRDLPVKVADEILADYAREMARQHTLWVKTKIDAKAFAKACKEVTDRCEDEEIRLAEIVGTGTEEAPVPVRWSFDFSQNTKRLIRQDTMEVVEEAAMTAEDRQGELFDRTQESIDNVNKCLGQGAKLEADEAIDPENDTEAVSDDENITEGRSESEDDIELAGADSGHPDDLEKDWPEPPGGES